MNRRWTQINADAKYLRPSAVQFQNQLRFRLLQFGELFLTCFSGFQMDRGIDYEIFLNRKDRKERKAIFDSRSTMSESFSVSTGSEFPFFATNDS